MQKEEKTKEKEPQQEEPNKENWDPFYGYENHFPRDSDPLENVPFTPI